MLIFVLGCRKIVDELGPHVVGRPGLGMTLRCFLGSTFSGLDLLLEFGEARKGSLSFLAVGLFGCHHSLIVADLFVDSAEGVDDFVDLCEPLLSLSKAAADLLELVAICEDVATL